MTTTSTWYLNSTLAQVPGTAAFEMTAAMRGENRTALAAAQVSLTEARRLYASSCVKFAAEHALPVFYEQVTEWAVNEANLLQEAMDAAAEQRDAGQPHAADPITSVYRSAASTRAGYAAAFSAFTDLLAVSGLSDYHLATLALEEENELACARRLMVPFLSTTPPLPAARYLKALELLTPRKKRPKNAAKIAGKKKKRRSKDDDKALSCGEMPQLARDFDKLSDSQSTTSASSST